MIDTPHQAPHQATTNDPQTGQHHLRTPQPSATYPGLDQCTLWYPGKAYITHWFSPPAPSRACHFLRASSARSFLSGASNLQHPQARGHPQHQPHPRARHAPGGLQTLQLCSLGRVPPAPCLAPPPSRTEQQRLQLARKHKQRHVPLAAKVLRGNMTCTGYWLKSNV
jgi:hypothetical protein